MPGAGEEVVRRKLFADKGVLELKNERRSREKVSSARLLKIICYQTHAGASRLIILLTLS